MCYVYLLCIRWSRPSFYPYLSFSLFNYFAPIDSLTLFRSYVLCVLTLSRMQSPLHILSVCNCLAPEDSLTLFRSYVLCVLTLSRVQSPLHILKPSLLDRLFKLKVGNERISMLVRLIFLHGSGLRILAGIRYRIHVAKFPNKPEALFPR